MTKQVVTAVDAHIEPEQESALIEGYRRMTNESQPDGLLRSDLLRGQDGAWRIQTTWRDIESLMALRKAGHPPAALVLLEGIGAEHSHGWFTVEHSIST